MLRKKKIVIPFIIVIAFVLLPVVIRLILFPPHKSPEMTGNYTVSVAEYTWIDTSRIETYSDTGENRSVTVKVWYPEEEGSYPLVLFSHGATGMIDSNTSTCAELASNGYVAVSIAHPYQAIYVKSTDGKMTFIDSGFLQDVMTDNGESSIEHEQAIYKNSRYWMEIRTGDINFVMDTILKKAATEEESPFHKINPDKIGVFGHSLGGATAVMVGRQRSDIDAVINLEGTMFGEYIGFEDGKYIYNDVPYPVPLLDVYSRAIYEAASAIQTQEYVNFYTGRNAVTFHKAVFEDAGHLNFTDLPVVSPVLGKMLGTGDTNALECIEKVNRMVLHFFDYYLKDAESLGIQEEY